MVVLDRVVVVVVVFLEDEEEREGAFFLLYRGFVVEVSVWSNYSIGLFHCTLHDSLMAYVLFEVCVCV